MTPSHSPQENSTPLQSLSSQMRPDHTPSRLLRHCQTSRAKPGFHALWNRVSPPRTSPTAAFSLLYTISVF
ncbi:hypothetical protein HanIR_Chr11g0533141 [Helianthus annuus]|nr:hypothetical protein HanIR_Chr11g0533141 [Helianthus annuus]